MDNKYSVDDILEEIKRKKLAKKGIDANGEPEFQKSTNMSSFIAADLNEPQKPINEPQIINSFKFESKVPKEETAFSSQTAVALENEATPAENFKFTAPPKQSKRIRTDNFSNAFGDNAFKPYENKSQEQLQEKHRKKFGDFIPTDVANTEIKPNINTTINAPLQPEENNVVNTESSAVPPKAVETPEKNVFKVNLKENFFDEFDKEHTQMDIPVKNMDSSNAAIGFTRNLPALKNDSEPKKKKMFSFGNGANDKKASFDDYNSPADASEILKDLKSVKMGYFIKLILTTVIFGTLLYLGLSYFYQQLPLPPFMFPEKDLQIFLGVSFGFVILAALICSSIVGGGLISLFTLKPDNDSPAALAVLATITQGIALVAMPEKLQDGVHMYFSVAVLCLIFNLLGKIIMANRVIRNFNVISGNNDKFAMLLLTDKSFAKEITKGQNLDNPCVALSCKAGFATNFMQNSYSEDFSENIGKIATPLLLIFSIILSVISYIINKDMFIALTVFNAMMCVCAPLTTTLISNIPLGKISKTLTKNNSAISGYQSLDDFDDVTTLAIDANELFVGGTVILHGIKAFSESRIDEAIVDAASVTQKASGILMDIFMEMIGQKQNILKDVDNLFYEDGMGISAWVDGKKVLIGNRDLITNHGINPPDINYENKFKRDGREVVYLANSGELIAMFVISYRGSDEMCDYLDWLASKGVSLSIYTTDPNITSKKIEEIFEYPADMVTIISSKSHSEFNEIACDKDKAPAKIIYDGSLISKIKAVCDIIIGKSAVVLGTVMQLIGIIVGYSVIAFLSFTKQMSLLEFYYLMAFQLIWAFLTIVVQCLRKYDI